MFYYLVRFVGTFVIYFLFFPKVIGKKNRHFTGKGLVVSNHRSMWDPLFITVVFRCHIYWMGKIELFKNKILGKLFMAGGAFPIHRGEADFPAIRHAFKLLREGKVLGLFPEGTRNKSDQIAPFEAGTSMFSLKNDAPIIPVIITGNYRFFRRMTIAIGQPIRLADQFGSKADAKTMAAATEYLEEQLKALQSSLG